VTGVYWLTRRKPVRHARRGDAVVVSVTSPLTRETALDLARQVERMPARSPVIIDLTAIPAFDSDGADALFGLQEAAGANRLSIVGFRQATERLVGVPGADLAGPDEIRRWSMRRLRNLVVVQPGEPSAGTDVGDLETVVAEAVQTDAAIVVVDLKGVPDLSASALDAIAFTSSAAAVRGMDLLVVNVCPEVAEALRVSAMSATTYVAPDPPFDPAAC
jgi:anti-anti-sigma regulatory factor